MRIEEYEFGRIVIDGREQDADVIITPSEVHPDWWRDEGHELKLSDLGVVLDESPEILVVGTGASARMRPASGLSTELRERGIKMEAMPTEDAVARANELFAEGANVAAALHLTC